LRSDASNTLADLRVTTKICTKDTELKKIFGVEMRLRLFLDFSRVGAHLQSASVGLEDPLITFLFVRNLLGGARFEDMHFSVPSSCFARTKTAVRFSSFLRLSGGTP